jgi:hypothetical protein
VEEMTEEQLNSLKCEQNITILKTEIIEWLLPSKNITK